MSEMADLPNDHPIEDESDRVHTVSISLPESLIGRIRRRIGAGSLNRYVIEAVEHRAQQDELAEWLQEMEAIHGPIPEDELDKAEQKWREVERQWRAETR